MCCRGVNRWIWRINLRGSLLICFILRIRVISCISLNFLMRRRGNCWLLISRGLLGIWGQRIRLLCPFHLPINMRRWRRVLNCLGSQCCRCYLPSPRRMATWGWWNCRCSVVNWCRRYLSWRRDTSTWGVLFSSSWRVLTWGIFVVIQTGEEIDGGNSIGAEWILLVFWIVACDDSAVEVAG